MRTLADEQYRDPAPRRRSDRRRALDAVQDALIARPHDRELDRARGDLRRTTPDFDAAVARMMDARPALPGAASYDGPTARGLSPSSSTERHATRTDPTAADRALLDRLLAQLLASATRLATGDDSPKTIGAITRDCWSLRRLITAWSPRHATARQRAERERANTGAPECQVTRDVLGIFEPVYRTTDLAGLLPEPTPVGRWVYDQSRKLGRLPTPMEMRRWASTNDDARNQLIGHSKAKAAVTAPS